MAVGEVPAEVSELMGVTEESMWRGIAAAHLGGRVTDISHAVERLRAGRRAGTASSRTTPATASAPQMHKPPNVPNYGRPGKGPRLVPGLALAVEPMITMGAKETDLLEDDWTVVTTDGSWAAHFEHTFTITPRAPGCSRRSTAASSSSASSAYVSEDAELVPFGPQRQGNAARACQLH